VRWAITVDPHAPMGATAKLSVDLVTLDEKPPTSHALGGAYATDKLALDTVLTATAKFNKYVSRSAACNRVRVASPCRWPPTKIPPLAATVVLSDMTLGEGTF
jgi:hypothetical protein